MILTFQPSLGKFQILSNSLLPVIQTVLKTSARNHTEMHRWSEDLMKTYSSAILSPSLQDLFKVLQNPFAKGFLSNTSAQDLHRQQRFSALIHLVTWHEILGSFRSEAHLRSTVSVDDAATFTVSSTGPCAAWPCDKV